MSRKYKFGAQKNNNAAKFQLWQPENHPIQLINTKMAHQKLDYIHYNSIEAGFVTKAEEWKYGSEYDILSRHRYPTAQSALLHICAREEKNILSRRRNKVILSLLIFRA